MGMNWSAIGALGAASESAGNYFGVLAVEKTRTQRLAESRAEDLADADTARTQKLEDTASLRDHQGEVRQEGVDNALAVTAATNLESDRRAIRNEALKGGPEVPPSEKYLETWTDPKTGQAFAVYEDNSMVPIEGMVDAVEEEGGSTTAGQDLIGMRSKQAQRGLSTIKGLIGEDGYNPGGLEAGWNSLTTGGITNFMATGAGQQFEQASGEVREAFLRTATGAAAPDSEVANYTRMYIPAFGDDAKTIQQKIRASEMQIANMDALAQKIESGEVEMSDEQALQAFKDSAEQVAQEAGLYGEPVSGVQAKDGSSRAGYSGTPTPSAGVSKYY